MILWDEINDEGQEQSWIARDLATLRRVRQQRELLCEETRSLAQMAREIRAGAQTARERSAALRETALRQQQRATAVLEARRR